MKIIITIYSIIMLSSCASNKSNGEASNTETAKQETTIPKCIETKIADFKAEPVQNPPITITKYTYKNEDVYLVSAPCCDQYSTVYNKQCEVIGHPSGGFTGTGDGTMTDFFDSATNKKVIWEDSRKE